MIQLCVLYPQPLDRGTFEADYAIHSQLIKEKIGKPFTVIKFLGGEQGDPAFYQIFMMSFSSMDEVESVLTPEVTDVLDADAFRISSGGEPVILLGRVEQPSHRHGGGDPLR